MTASRRLGGGPPRAGGLRPAFTEEAVAALGPDEADAF